MFHFKEGLDEALFLQAIQYAKCNQGGDTCNCYDSPEPQETYHADLVHSVGTWSSVNRMLGVSQLGNVPRRP